MGPITAPAIQALEPDEGSGVGLAVWESLGVCDWDSAVLEAVDAVEGTEEERVRDMSR
jgi:hypothetical protein